jgi:hypothetical protein
MLDVPAVSQDWVIASLYCKKLLSLKVKVKFILFLNKNKFFFYANEKKCTRTGILLTRIFFH